MFVYPADEILFSRPSAWSLEEFQRIHSSRWGVLVSAIQANICPHLILHSASTKPPSVIYKRKVRTSESPGKEANGFFYVIRHLPDETKGPFIDKLVKKTQDSWFLKSSVFALPIFWSRLSVSTAGQRGGYYVWKRGWGQTRLNDPMLNDEATELRSRWGLHAICFNVDVLLLGISPRLPKLEVDYWLNYILDMSGKDSSVAKNLGWSSPREDLCFANSG